MKRIVRRDEGVSNVISSIMLLAITLSVVGTVMEIYLPAWGKDVESRHMEDTVTQIYNLRSIIEEQNVLGVEGAVSSSVFSMGSPGGALFGTGRVWGSMDVITASGQCEVTDSTGSTIYGRGVGYILYTADNGYIEDYSLLYQQGAIVMKQGDSLVLKAPPEVFLTHSPAPGGGTLRSLKVNLVSFDGESSTHGSSSNALIEVRAVTTFYTTYDFEGGQTLLVSISFPEGYGSAVVSYFEDELSAEGLTESEYNVTLSSPSGGEELLTLRIDSVDSLVLNIITAEVRVYV